MSAVLGELAHSHRGIIYRAGIWGAVPERDRAPRDHSGHPALMDTLTQFDVQMRIAGFGGSQRIGGAGGNRTHV